MAPLLFSLCGLRGLTSIIGRRMEAHYKISALCLSIRVTEKGLVVLPCHGEPSTRRLTKPGSRGSDGEQEEGTKPAEILLKRLICNLLTLVARQGYKCAKAGPIALRDSPISHIRRQALPEGFIYERAEKLSRGRRDIRLVLVWHQRMQIYYK